MNRKNGSNIASEKKNAKKMSKNYFKWKSTAECSV